MTEEKIEKNDRKFGGGKMGGFFSEEMKEQLMKNLKRVFAVLGLVGIGWVIVISIYAFVWSGNYTFYQNLVVTFDVFIVALIIGLVLIYKISGIGEIMKKFKGITEKSTKDEEC